MSLKTYERDPVTDAWPLYNMGDGSSPASNVGLRPGDYVRHAGPPASGHGMVVASDDTHVTVLWSVEPRDPLAVMFPTIRRVSSPLVGSQFINVQPMSVPNGKVFYMDYVYGVQDAQGVSVPSTNAMKHQAKKRAHSRPKKKH